jgi:hypothetical protein
MLYGKLNDLKKFVHFIQKINIKINVKNGCAIDKWGAFLVKYKIEYYRRGGKYHGRASL